MFNINIENKKARYDYFIEDTIEAGIELRGNEVKSISEGQASIKESWVDIINGQVYIKQMFINPWRTSNKFDISERRDRRLLLHKAEINKLSNKLKIDGYALVPLKVYFSNDSHKCKVLIGLCRGKKSYDKRDSIKKRDLERESGRKFK